MNGIVFGVDTLLKEKIIFNVNNHIQFVKFLSIVHGFNNVERFLNTVYAYAVCTVIFVLAFYSICTIYLRSETNNGFYGHFLGWRSTYFYLCTMLVVELRHLLQVFQQCFQITFFHLMTYVNITYFLNRSIRRERKRERLKERE